MKAIVCHRYGSPDVLELEEIDTPVAGDDQVLVRVQAASVNPVDWHRMRGLPNFMRASEGLAKPKNPGLGADVAGRVEAVGGNVTQFQPGDYVDVIGRSKGKGFQGVMKKHNFHGQGAAHGSKTHRRIGAVGNRSTPGRIWKNQGMPGHLGDERVTVQNLQVMQVRETEKIILISGAVPGANGSYVIVRPAIKNPGARIADHQAHRKADQAEAAKKPAITVR